MLHWKSKGGRWKVKRCQGEKGNSIDARLDVETLSVLHWKSKGERWKVKRCQGEKGGVKGASG